MLDFPLPKGAQEMMVFICQFEQAVQTCLALNLIFLAQINHQVAIFMQSSSFYQSHSEIIL